MELYLGDKPLQVPAPNVPAKLSDGSDSDQETVNDALFLNDVLLQDQINALVVGGSKGEWRVRVGGPPVDQDTSPDGDLMITTAVWSDVDFLWFKLTDVEGISHNFSFLTLGDRIRVFQGDSFGTYRVINYSDTDPGKVYVEPMLTGLAGSVQDGELASITMEDLDGSGGGNSTNALVPPVRWGELIFGQGNNGLFDEETGEANVANVLIPPVTWGELIANP